MQAQVHKSYYINKFLKIFYLPLFLTFFRRLNKMNRSRPKKKDFLKKLAQLNFKGKWIKIEGNSMNPSLKEGQYVLLDKKYYRSNPVRRGDLIAFKSEPTGEKYLIKRIIGLPHEFVEIKDSEVLIDKKRYRTIKEIKIINNSTYFGLELHEKEYFVLGDNLDNSFDSRKLGGIKSSDIIGLIWFRLWPPSIL